MVNYYNDQKLLEFAMFLPACYCLVAIKDCKSPTPLNITTRHLSINIPLRIGLDIDNNFWFPKKS